MLSTVSRDVERVLLQTIRDQYHVEYERLNFSTPPRIELGELALPVAFDLARRIKRSPRDIAQELAAAARKIPGVWKAEVAGGGISICTSAAPPWLCAWPRVSTSSVTAGWKSLILTAKSLSNTPISILIK